MAKMTKKQVMDLADRYNLDILRDPITGEAKGVMGESDKLIPELDDLTDEHGKDDVCVAIRELIADTYRYTIYCPVHWFDLGGWKISEKSPLLDAEQIEVIPMSVNEIRRLSGLSQAKFAERYNLQSRNVERWESGDRTPPAYVTDLLLRAVVGDARQHGIPTEMQIAILVESGCTRSDAMRHLRNGTIIFESPDEWIKTQEVDDVIDWYMDQLDVSSAGDVRSALIDGKIKDNVPVKWMGYTWIVQYVL